MRRLRLARGLTQLEVALLVCRGRAATISELERGLLDPRLSLLVDLARVYGVSASDVLAARLGGGPGGGSRAGYHQKKRIIESTRPLVTSHSPAPARAD